MAVQVIVGLVVAHCGPRGSVTGGDLDISEVNAGVDVKCIGARSCEIQDDRQIRARFQICQDCEFVFEEKKARTCRGQ